jgi:hypothetical protein
MAGAGGERVTGAGLELRTGVSSQTEDGQERAGG